MDKKHLMSIFILVILALSVFGIALQYNLNDSTSVKIRGTKFTQFNGGWVGYKDNNKIFITTQPDLLKDIKVPEVSLSQLNSISKIYFSTNPNNQIPNNAIFSIQESLFPYLNPVTVSCTEDSTACAALPIKTCSDASDSTAVIQTQISDIEKISFENNCLLIQGPREKIVYLVEAAILKLNGI